MQQIRFIVGREEGSGNAANLSTSQKAQNEDAAAAGVKRARFFLCAGFSIPYVITFNCYCNCKLQPKRVYFPLMLLMRLRVANMSGRRWEEGTEECIQACTCAPPFALRAATADRPTERS